MQINRANEIMKLEINRVNEIMKLCGKEWVWPENVCSTLLASLQCQTDP